METIFPFILGGSITSPPNKVYVQSATNVTSSIVKGRGWVVFSINGTIVYSKSSTSDITIPPNISWVDVLKLSVPDIVPPASLNLKVGDRFTVTQTAYGALSVPHEGHDPWVWIKKHEISQTFEVVAP